MKLITIIALLATSLCSIAQTVKFSQVERSTTKWHIPVGKRALPGLTGYSMQYMDFVL